MHKRSFDVKIPRLREGAAGIIRALTRLSQHDRCGNSDGCQGSNWQRTYTHSRPTQFLSFFLQRDFHRLFVFRASFIVCTCTFAQGVFMGSRRGLSISRSCLPSAISHTFMSGSRQMLANMIMLMLALYYTRVAPSYDNYRMCKPSILPLYSFSAPFPHPRRCAIYRSREVGAINAVHMMVEPLKWLPRTLLIRAALFLIGVREPLITIIRWRNFY